MGLSPNTDLINNKRGTIEDSNTPFLHKKVPSSCPRKRKESATESLGRADTAIEGLTKPSRVYNL